MKFPNMALARKGNLEINLILSLWDYTNDSGFSYFCFSLISYNTE